jgi:RimJ/RimL family protein N-acetyltransferase
MTLLAPGLEGNVQLPVLETERLTLRAPCLDSLRCACPYRKTGVHFSGTCANDAAAVAALVNDRRIAENTARIPHPYSIADAQAFFAHANRRDGELALLITLADGEIIGGCGLGVLSGPDPEIGYWIGLPYWGRGYATEAARALIDHAFGTLGYERLLGGARVSNPASRRVLEKCGFQWTGVALTRIRALASSAPVDRFRLDRALWASLKS